MTTLTRSAVRTAAASRSVISGLPATFSNSSSLVIIPKRCTENVPTPRSLTIASDT